MRIRLALGVSLGIHIFIIFTVASITGSVEPPLSIATSGDYVVLSLQEPPTTWRTTDARAHKMGPKPLSSRSRDHQRAKLRSGSTEGPGRAETGKNASYAANDRSPASAKAMGSTAYLPKEPISPENNGNTAGDGPQGSLGETAEQGTQRSSPGDEQGQRKVGPWGELKPAQLATKKVVPPYPLSSRRRGEEGTVVISLTLRHGLPEKGTVATSSGYRALDQAALGAALLWRFPEDIDDTVLIPFHFTLRD